MNRTPVKIRAIYADTDAMGIVYHTNYIRWFEVGRNELCRDMGILAADLQAAGFNLPLTRVYCHYRIPARYDQMVRVETEIAYLKWASMKFAYKIRDENGSNVLAEGYTVHACTEGNGKIIRIPSPISEKIRAYYPNL